MIGPANKDKPPTSTIAVPGFFDWNKTEHTARAELGLRRRREQVDSQ
jgi:hypothetical protein